MSKSDAQRRSYLADQMTMGERVEALERRVDEIDNPGRTHFVGDDCAGGHQPSPTECGRIVVDAGEWERLLRVEAEARAWLEVFDTVPVTSWTGECTDALREALKP